MRKIYIFSVLGKCSNIKLFKFKDTKNVFDDDIIMVFFFFISYCIFLKVKLFRNKIYLYYFKKCVK